MGKTKGLFIVYSLLFMAMVWLSPGFAQSDNTLFTEEQVYNNLIADASFESWSAGTTGANALPDAWTKVGTPTQYDKLTNDKRVGSASLKITADADATVDGISQAVTVEPNTTYTVGFYCKTTTGSLDFTITGTITPSLTGNTALSAADWTYKSFTFTTGAATSSLTLNFKSTAASAVYSLDGAMLTRGPLAPAVSEKPIYDTGTQSLYGNLTIEKDSATGGDLTVRGDLTVVGSQTIQGSTIYEGIETVRVTNTQALLVEKATADGGDDVFIVNTTNKVVGINKTPSPTVELDVSGDIAGLSLTIDNIGIDAAAITPTAAMTVGSDTYTTQIDGSTITLSGNSVADGTLDIRGAISNTGASNSGYVYVNDTLQVVTDAILPTGSIGAGELAAGAVLRAKLSELMPAAQTTPDKTLAISAARTYVSGNALLDFAATNANFGSGGNCQYTAAASGKFVKALVSLGSAGTLSATFGTEQTSAATAQSEDLTYPLDKVPIVEVILKTIGTGAGAVENIEGTAGSLSYIYQDVRPFITLGSGSGASSITSTTADNFTIDSDYNGTNPSLRFQTGSGTYESITYDETNSEFDFSKRINVTGDMITSGNITLSTANATVDGVNLDNVVLNTRAINTGAGLQGGGNLTADRSLSVRLNSNAGLVSNLGTGTNELGINLATNSGLTITTNALGVGVGTGLAASGGTLSLSSTYVDGSAYDTRFVNVTGDTMTGNLIVGDAVIDTLTLATADPTDNSITDSSTLILQGRYDSNGATAGVVSANRLWQIINDMGGTGASPTTSLVFDSDEDTADEMVLDSSGNLTLLGNITLSTANATVDDVNLDSALTGLTAGTGISISGTGHTREITNSDLGSSQLIFKNITDGTITAAADTNSDTFTLSSANTILGIAVNATTDTATFTVNQANIDHGTISGLGDDDHPQYGALAHNEVVTGSWTFGDNYTDTLTIDSEPAVDQSYVDSPTLVLRGSYDANATVGPVTATDYNATIIHNLTSAAPASSLDFNIAGSSVEMSLTSAGNLTVAGTINNQTLGATSSLGALNLSGDLTLNQNSATVDDVYFAVQHNASNIFSVDREGDVTIGGDLIVQGTQTILNVQTVEVESSTIKMNRNAVGPALNASIVVERGSSPDTAIRWNESSGVWDLTKDGTNYYTILDSNTTHAAAAGSDATVSGAYNALDVQLKSGVVTTTEIFDGTIAEGDIATNAVTSAKIAADTIVAGDIATGAVETTEILDGTIANADVSTTAAIAGTKISPDFGSQNIITTGYIRQLRTIYLVPEFENSLSRPDGSSNRGTLKTTYANNHSYYEWTTNEPVAQDYDIVVRVKLQEGFSSFDATTPIKLYTKSSEYADANTKVIVQMKDSGGNVVNLNGAASVALRGLATTGAWDEATITIGTPTVAFASGQWVTFILTLQANQNDTIDVGELSLKGNW